MTIKEMVELQKEKNFARFVLHTKENNIMLAGASYAAYMVDVVILDKISCIEDMNELYDGISAICDQLEEIEDRIGGIVWGKNEQEHYTVSFAACECVEVSRFIRREHLAGRI